MHVGFNQAALGHPGRAKAQGAGFGGVTVARHSVAVADDVGQIDDARGDVTTERHTIVGDRLTVQQGHMRISAAVYHPQTVLGQAHGQRSSVLFDLALQRLKLRRHGDLKSSSDAGHFIDVRAALHAREHRPVNLLGQLFISRNDHCAAWAKKRFVGGEGRHMCDTNRIWVIATHGHAGRVRDVGQQICTHRISDLAELFEVGRKRI